MQRSSILHPRSSALPTRRPAYTLLEVMVVVVIIVLMIGMALPVFHVITGSRSEAGASNIIASTLSRARADALGLQKYIGVAFVYSDTKQQSYMAEVEFEDCPSWIAGQPYAVGQYVTNPNALSSPYYYCIAAQPNTLSAFPGTGTYWVQLGGPPLDIRQDTDLQPLPTGVGVQTICNVIVPTAARHSDGYLRLGVILFDGQGRMTSQYYGISQYSKLLTSIGLTGISNTDYPTPAWSTNYSSVFGVQSQFGLVIYQNEAFLSYKSSALDLIYTTQPGSQASAYGAGTPSQSTEEAWLDQNATPVLIDRYTGTLIKAE